MLSCLEIQSKIIYDILIQEFLSKYTFFQFSELKRLQGEPTMMREKPAFIPGTTLYLVGSAIILVFLLRLRKLYDKYQEKKKQNVVGIINVIEMSNLSLNPNQSPSINPSPDLSPRPCSTSIVIDICHDSTNPSPNEHQDSDPGSNSSPSPIPDPPCPTPRSQILNNIPINPEVTSEKLIVIMAIISLGLIISTSKIYYSDSPMNSWWSEFEYFLIADMSISLALCLIFPMILYCQDEKLRSFIWQKLTI